jgi:lipopolysaccharide export system ATP-binding protein
VTGPSDSARGQATRQRVEQLVEQLARGDRSTALALHSIIAAADESGSADFETVVRAFRDDYLGAVRADGRDAEREAGRLSMDEVRQHLATSVIPRLIADGVVMSWANASEEGGVPPRVQLQSRVWTEIAGEREEVATALRHTGEHAGLATPASTAAVAPPAGAPAGGFRDTPLAAIADAPPLVGGSVLEARGLVKTYRRRRVVNDVALRLQQGEIVGLLGPNGAGKTTTFYMIVGLIQPLAGRILLDGADITSMPMYKRARQGIGYLSQEPSIFRKLSVEDNILAILETLGLSASERRARLESLLDELSIKHLRESKAFALSGGERRRLEITRALVTQPKFMMLDEPFAGVDPIAVHDIQQIVANLRHRGIGVLISDHNVEQTLDIVDRAYIMFDGQVKVSGTVRELVFDDTVADIYLGPTLTARLRARFAADDASSVAPPRETNAT